MKLAMRVDMNPMLVDPAAQADALTRAQTALAQQLMDRLKPAITVRDLGPDPGRPQARSFEYSLDLDEVVRLIQQQSQVLNPSGPYTSYPVQAHPLLGSLPQGWLPPLPPVIPDLLQQQLQLQQLQQQAVMGALLRAALTSPPVDSPEPAPAPTGPKTTKELLEEARVH